MATTIKIRNMFHGTSATVRVADDRMPADAEELAGNLDAVLTDSQKRRVHKALCGQGTWGWPSCCCRSHGPGLKIEIVKISARIKRLEDLEQAHQRG